MAISTLYPSVLSVLCLLGVAGGYQELYATAGTTVSRRLLALNPKAGEQSALALQAVSSLSAAIIPDLKAPPRPSPGGYGRPSALEPSRSLPPPPLESVPSGSPSSSTVCTFPSSSSSGGGGSVPVAGLEGGGCTDAQATLDRINRLRALHQVAPLCWSSELAAAAQSSADLLAAGGCTAPLVHSSLGELLYWQSGVSELGVCRYAVADWYSESGLYKYSRTPFTDNVLNSRNDISHFTQVVCGGLSNCMTWVEAGLVVVVLVVVAARGLVWRSSYMVGCGVQKSAVGYYSPCSYVVCRFSSPGNQKGDVFFLLNAEVCDMTDWGCSRPYKREVLRGGDAWWFECYHPSRPERSRSM
ncbi:hypothetical protein VOLCADRAFT_90221 [Volvox carteri f. nagariensis]|uniref:SCP domain-containing protein n=1 Tax=Volvox carteri f. nagariensis TaxID=3068 RepID=D8TTT0_VOLCA|nr:uncharacterized protein VOLCADRAFT_90221 [Volvox carteri f. nagariensis]EFJ48917.1 hypothetical protein VOLCADRAFT_90221 [Volvox carteri f. nagariensis]|eukprot:XP_002949814.1 hypothetical protein VOLCADRAFT_90221 [Volvox carteri f. nagariensis]